MGPALNIVIIISNIPNTNAPKYLFFPGLIYFTIMYTEFEHSTIISVIN